MHFERNGEKMRNLGVVIRRVNQKQRAGSVINRVTRVSIVIKRLKMGVSDVEMLHIELRIVRRKSRQVRRRRVRNLFLRGTCARYVASAVIGSGSVHKREKKSKDI